MDSAAPPTTTEYVQMPALEFRQMPVEICIFDRCIHIFIAGKVIEWQDRAARLPCLAKSRGHGKKHPPAIPAFARILSSEQ